MAGRELGDGAARLAQVGPVGRRPFGLDAVGRAGDDRREAWSKDEIEDAQPGDDEDFRAAGGAEGGGTVMGEKARKSRPGGKARGRIVGEAGRDGLESAAVSVAGCRTDDAVAGLGKDRSGIEIETGTVTGETVGQRFDAQPVLDAREMGDLVGV